MSQSATAPLAFAPPVTLLLLADFQGGCLTSHGGWCWVAEADLALALGATFEAAVPARRRRCQHAWRAILQQQLYQIPADYADQDDADALRGAPHLKLVSGSGRLPESDPNLAIGQSRNT